MCVLVHEKWAVFSGGGFRAHLNLFPFGCDGLMTPFMSFRPKVAQDYWASLQAGDTAKALSVYRDVEEPLEKFMRTFPGGRDAAIHGLFELCGLAGRWRRKPYHSLTDEQMEQLKTHAKELGLL